MNLKTVALLNRAHMRPLHIIGALAVFVINGGAQFPQVAAQSTTAREYVVGEGDRVGTVASANTVKSGGGTTIVFTGNASIGTAHYNIMGGTGNNNNVYGGIEAGPIVFRSNIVGDYRTLDLNRYSILPGRNQTVELYDMILTNGYHSDGGAIQFRGSGGGTGGGLSNAVDGAVGIVRGNFIIQSSTANGTGNNRGGAIYGKNSSVVIDITPSGTAIFRNNYAKSWGGAVAAYAGEITITGGDVIFEGNESEDKGGAIVVNAVNPNHIANSPWDNLVRRGVIQIDSKSLFRNNKSKGVGGAIASAGNVILDGQAIFINNTAGGNGGAVFSNGANWVDTGINWFDVQVIVDGTDLTPTWLYGKPNRPARVFDNFEVVASSTFIGNSAGGSGGAVYVGGSSAKIGENTAFINNTAVSNGGAIYINSGTLVLNHVTFEGNTANLGGALYINNAHVTMGSENTFLGNSAHSTGGGGLAYVNNGTLEISATDRDMVFQGFYAADIPNAIGLGVGGKLIVDTGIDGHTVTFLDGIVGGGTNAIITHTGMGTLILDDVGNAGLFSTINASLNLVSGTMKVINASVDWGIKGITTATNNITIGDGAYFYGQGGFSTGIGEIYVGDNATLEMPDGGAYVFSANTVDGGLITFGTGVSLIGSGSIIIDAVNPVDVRAGNISIGSWDTVETTPQQLTITGGQSRVVIDDGGMVNLGIFGNSVSSQLIVNSLAVTGTAYLNLIGSESSQYKIITANTDISSCNFTLLMNGAAPVGRYAPVLQFENSNTEIWIDFLIKNFGMTWVGDTNAIWKSALEDDNANWTDGAVTSPERFFLDGDRVTFADAGIAKNITITGDGVTVAEMIVDNTAGNDYTFAGTGGIVASDSNSIALAATGKLVKKGAGTLGFENTGTNIFAKGIELWDGVLRFSAASQILDGGNGITIYNSSTLRPNAAALTIANNLVLDSAASALAVDVEAGKMLIHTGQISGAGSMAKIGAGTLVLTADNATSLSGMVYANSGKLYIDGGALATVSVANGAAFGGSGTITSITVASGGIVQSGMPDTAGALDVDTLDISAGNAVINFSILGGGQSSSLNVANAPAPGTGNSINVNNWIPGTYNLGNLTGLVAASSIDYRGETLNNRQSYTTDIGSGSILLTINPTNNTALYWTGTDGSVNGRWDTPSQSWRDASGDVVNPFVNYDVVIFDDRVAAAAYRSVNVSNTMAVSSMTVSGNGDYTLGGDGGIVASTSGVYGYAGTGTNSKLTKVGPGKLTFANASPNLFQGGIDLGASGTTGGTLEFSSVQQIMTGAGSPIFFIGDTTLRALAGSEGNIASNIVIDGNVTATLDIGGGDIDLSGSVALSGANGTLAKTGAGTLLYSGTTTAAGLSTRITEGRVLLSGGILSGTISLAAANALFGGYGSAPGTVRASANTTVLVGFDSMGGSNASGLLSIGTLELSDGSNITGSGTLAATTSVAGLVTVRVATGDKLTFAGAGTGAGSIVKTGGGSLIYTTALTLGYDGGTQINDGYVMFRGFSGGASHTITLNGGWLDLSDAGAFDPSGATTNDWSGLTINEGANAALGGVIGVNDRIRLDAGDIVSNIGMDGHNGIYVVIDAGAGGVATLTGTNTYAGYTRIDSGTLRVEDDTHLGSATTQREVILNGGALQITGTLATTRQLEVRTSGIIDTLEDTTWAAITGTGFLTKTGSATLKIDAASTAGSLAVNEGRYEVVHGQGFGAGQVAVASGAVVEMHDVVNNSTVSNHFTGAGTLNLDNDIIVLTGTSAIARINIIQTSLVTALGSHSLGNADTQLVIDNSQILLGALENTLGKVTLANNSIIAFGKDTDFKRASISTLSGGGTLVFNTDLAREKTDHITIGAAPDGHYDIVVNNAGGAPEHSVSGVAYEIISAPMGAATYALDGGQVDVGMHVFRLHQKDEDGMLSVSLIGTEFLTRTGLYINNTAGAASLTWFSELDSLQKRLSELKYEPGAKNGISAWARGRVERYNYGAKATGEPFNETQWGANAGFDYVFRGKDSDIYLGAFMGYGHATRNAEIRWGGESESDSMQGGIYATIVNVNGWHVDGMLKYNRFDNDMTIHINSRETITASYTAAAIGGSIEVSKEFDFGSGWYVRPRFQGAMVVLLPTDYQTSGYQTGDSMHIKISRGSVTQGLLGVQLGRSFATKSGQFFQPYVNAFGAVQETAGGRLYADNEEFTPWIKGSRFGGGGGINWMPGKATLFYIDYEYSKSDYYDKPWGVNFGVRHSW